MKVYKGRKCYYYLYYYLMRHYADFIYGYMAKGTYNSYYIAREETHCCHFMCYCFPLAARYRLLAPSNKGYYIPRS